jgi:hypothetical protein
MSIMETLELFNRPEQAVANAVYTGLYDPNSSAMSGFWKGLMGDEERSWGDVVGIPAPTSEDAWLPWLAKGGSRLALDVAGDPLNLLFGSGAIAKGVRALPGIRHASEGAGKLLTRAGEAYAAGKIPLLGETPVQLFGGKLSPEWFGGKAGDFEDAWVRALREGNTEELLNLANNASREQKAYLEASGASPLGLFDQLETRAFDPAAEKVVGALQPLRESAAENAQRLIDWAQKKNMPGFATQLLDETGQAYMPHMLTETGQRAAGGTRRIGELGYDPNLEMKSRDILNWNNPEGQGVTIGKLSDKRTGVQSYTDPATGETRYYYGGTYDPSAVVGQKTINVPEHEYVKKISKGHEIPDPFWERVRNLPQEDLDRMGITQETMDKFWNVKAGMAGTDPLWSTIKIPAHESRVLQKGLLEGGEEVTPAQATLSQKAAEYPGLDWVTDPTAAIYKTAKTRQEQVNFTKFLDSLEQQGLLRSAEEIPANQIADWRPLSVPGFTNLEAPVWAANRIENMTSGKFGFPAKGRNAIEDLAIKYGDSDIAKGIERATQTWRRNVLAWPGWIAGNLGSNLISLQQARQFSPVNIYDAVKALAGKDGHAVPGLTLPNFADEMAMRGIKGAGQSGQELLNEFEEVLRGKGRLRQATEDATTWAKGKELGTLAPAIEKVGGAVSTVGEKWGAYNTWMLQKGAKLEDASRLAAALGYLRDNAKQFDRLSPEAQQTILDKAATFGKEAMIEQRNLTPTERVVGKTIVPFYPWLKGATKRTASLALHDPAALANTERIMRTLFQPMDPQDKEMMDPWMRESGPVKGGWFGEATGMGSSSMLMTGRFQPQGVVEQFSGRPVDALVGSLNPLLKAPYELMANANTFKGRPIDRVAGGFPGNVINPLIGRPYELAGSTMFGQQLPAAWAHLVGQSPIGRGVSTVSDFGRQAGLWNDPYKGEGTFLAGSAYALSGGKALPFDQNRFMRSRQNEQNRKVNDIQNLLKRAVQVGDLQGIQHYREELLDAIQRPAGGVHLEGS